MSHPLFDRFVQPNIVERKNLRLTSLLTLLLIPFLFISCSEDEESLAPESKKKKGPERISKIEISQFGKVTQLLMNYEKDVINIEFQPYEGNVEARIELNERKQIREILSGPSRIQYLYDENGREVGIFSDNGQQQIMFDYDGENISHQFTINGNDTVVKFRYSYVNGSPSEVEIIGAYPFYRKYKLEYSDKENSLSGFNELILPSETVSMLGIPAMYGKKYLTRATRIDDKAGEKAPLQEGYTPSFEELTFDISKSRKKETLKLTSDGSRQWSAVIYW